MVQGPLVDTPKQANLVFGCTLLRLIRKSSNPQFLIWIRGLNPRLLKRVIGTPHHLSPFSPTAESFGVSAQIGSGVVRGGPEVRFYKGSTRVPPDFHLVLRGLRGGPGHHGLTKFYEGCGVVRGGLRQGSTRVPPGFEVRFHETRVQRGFQGSTKF